jgi:membrane-bound lytic murein transglycosylase A
MRKILALMTLGLGLTLFSSHAFFAQDQVLPLQSVEQPVDESLGWDEQLWGSFEKPGDRQALLRALDYSRQYLNTPNAIKAYQNYPVPGLTRDRVRRSLIRFRQLLVKAESPAELQAAVKREFVLYQSLGEDKLGNVHFTGYFEPVYPASRTPTAEYSYPLYRKPANFKSWSKPHPTRLQLEGSDGLLRKQSPLSGNELVWLRARLEAYLVQVQGSARLQLKGGGVMTVGHDGNTDYPYTSLGRELIKEGKFTAEQLTLPVLLDYFRANPEQLDEYVPRNNRFIFFRETKGAPATGSLGVPVTADRSIATDKSIMPPGALALIQTSIPYFNSSGKLEASLVNRYVLDQDTGSAIKGAGRVDIFLGTGKIAGDRAGLISGRGKLYYLLLK